MKAILIFKIIEIALTILLFVSFPTILAFFIIRYLEKSDQTDEDFWDEIQ
jgi:hypothetical protein